LFARVYDVIDVFYGHVTQQGALIREWRTRNPSRGEKEDKRILDFYAGMVIEEVVQRAKRAAYRTIHW